MQVVAPPTLTLSNAATASYISGTGSTALVFRYTVAEGDTESSDLSVSSYNGTIKDSAGNTAGAASGDLGTVIVDLTAPTLSSVAAADATYKVGHNIDITVTWSETVTKTVEYGKVYNVQFKSGGKGKLTKGKTVAFTGLHSANNPIEVTNNNTRLCLKDGHGGDCNASFTIDKGNVRFSDDGKTIVGTGKATFTLSWNDNPRTAGTALGTIKIMDKSWTQSGRSGSKTQTVTITSSDDAGSNSRSVKSEI